MYKTINIPFTVISAREFRAGCIVGNKPSTNSLCARCFNLICLYSAVWSHATFLFIREQWQVNDYILDLCRKARFLARLLPVVFLWMSAGWRSELTCHCHTQSCRNLCLRRSKVTTSPRHHPYEIFILCGNFLQGGRVEDAGAGCLIRAVAVLLQWTRPVSF